MRILQFVFVDLFETISVLCVGLSCFNFPIRNNLKRLILIAALYAIAQSVLSSYDVPPLWKVSTLYALQTVLVAKLFKVGWGLSIGISTCTYVFLIPTEAILFSVWRAIFHLDFEVITSQSQLLLNLFTIAYSAILLLIATVFYLFRVDIRKRMPQMNNLALISLIVSGAINLVLMVALASAYYLTRVESPDYYQKFYEQLEFYFIPLILAFAALVVTIWWYIRVTITKVEKETEEPYTKSLNDLSVAVKSIKHDALSHYQTILGFLKLKDYLKVDEYVRELVKEAQAVISNVQGVKNPTIAALLHSKYLVYAGKGIDCQIKVSPEGSQLSNWKDIDTVKVLGNLIDNAAAAAMLVSAEEDRYLRLEWGVREGEEYLVVENTGPTIPEEALGKIFDLGYTTRENGEGGIGLPVVKATVAKYGGTISVVSRHGITRFTVTIPAPKQNTATA